MNKFRKYNEFIRYFIVGVLTTIVSLTTYYLLTIAFLDPKKAIELQIANVISWIIAVIFAYITNRIFVFKSKSVKILKEFFLFSCSRIVTLVIDMFMMFMMVTVFNVNDRLSKLIVQIIIIFLNYLFSKFFVFSNKE